MAWHTVKQRCLEGKSRYDDQWPTRTNQAMNLNINAQPSGWQNWMQIWTLCDCDSKSPRSRAATNSNHKPQIVLQTTLNMAKCRCKPVACWCFLYPSVILKLCSFQINFVRALHGGSSLESPNVTSPRMRYMSIVTLSFSVSMTITAPHTLAIHVFETWNCLGLASWMFWVLPTPLRCQVSSSKGFNMIQVSSGALCQFAKLLQKALICKEFFSKIQVAFSLLLATPWTDEDQGFCKSVDAILLQGLGIEIRFNFTCNRNKVGSILFVASCHINRCSFILKIPEAFRTLGRGTAMGRDRKCKQCQMSTCMLHYSTLQLRSSLYGSF